MHSCAHRQNCTVTQRALCVNTLFLWFSSFTADINPGFAVDRHVLGCVRSLVSLSLLSFTVHTLPWTPQDLYSFCLLINPHQRLWMPLRQTYNTLLSASRLLFYFIHKQVKPVPLPTARNTITSRDSLCLILDLVDSPHRNSSNITCVFHHLPHKCACWGCNGKSRNDLVLRL